MKGRPSVGWACHVNMTAMALNDVLADVQPEARGVLLACAWWRRSKMPGRCSAGIPSPWSLMLTCTVALSEGDVAQARWLLEEALATLRQLGDQHSIASVLDVFACLTARHGGTTRALTGGRRRQPAHRAGCTPRASLAVRSRRSRGKARVTSWDTPPALPRVPRARPWRYHLSSTDCRDPSLETDTARVSYITAGLDVSVTGTE
jgi:hypothetical protein